ncbi:MAG: SRPBCC domain-containing protein [Paracoccaceae bacterium]
MSGPAGRETGRFIIADGPGAGLHENAITYLDIVENARIVYACAMSWDGRVHSASLATVSFAPTEAGCRLTLTEQGAHFALRRPRCASGGIDAQLDRLAALFA